MEGSDVTDLGPARPNDEGHEDEGPPGIFGSWNALYLTVGVYAFLLISILYFLSVNLDYSGS